MVEDEEREQRRAQLRADFPQMAAVVDDFRRVFGDVRVRWIYENGKEIGKKGPEGVIASASPKIPEKRKRAAS